MKKTHLSIRIKFTALATILVLGATAAWGVWSWHRESELLEESLRIKSRILISSMAIPFINAFLYEELEIIEEGGLLDEFISDIMDQDALAPIYAMVLDNDGRILAHNDFKEYGKLLDDELIRHAKATGSFLVHETQINGIPAWEITYPLAIYGKSWGTLRVGISLEPLLAELRQLGRQIALFAVLFGISAIALFYLIGRGLSRPLIRLRDRMEKVGSGQLLDSLSFPGRNDEIGDLERGFRNMVERLNNAEIDRGEAFQKLLDSEKLVAVGQTVAGVAHEVNNPVAAIETALFHLEKNGTDKTGPYIKIVRDGIDRISGVVSQLLDLSRSGELDLQTVHLPVFCQDAALFARMAVKERQINFEMCGKPPDITLNIDRAKVHQALLNLFVNAADAAGEEGRVRFSCEVRKDHIAFQISDNGSGVPEELRSRIFQPFFSTKPAGQGSGMGLAVSRRIAEVHGGRLMLEESEEGARFVLILPLEKRREKSE